MTTRGCSSASGQSPGHCVQAGPAVDRSTPARWKTCNSAWPIMPDGQFETTALAFARALRMTYAGARGRRSAHMAKALKAALAPPKVPKEGTTATVLDILEIRRAQLEAWCRGEKPCGIHLITRENLTVLANDGVIPHGEIDNMLAFAASNQGVLESSRSSGSPARARRGDHRHQAHRPTEWPSRAFPASPSRCGRRATSGTAPRPSAAPTARRCGRAEGHLPESPLYRFPPPAAVVEALPKPGKPRVRATAEQFRAILREHGYHREPGLEQKRMPRSGDGGTHELSPVDHRHHDGATRLPPQFGEISFARRRTTRWQCSLASAKTSALRAAAPAVDRRMSPLRRQSAGGRPLAGLRLLRPLGGRRSGCHTL